MGIMSLAMRGVARIATTERMKSRLAANVMPSFPLLVNWMAAKPPGAATISKIPTFVSLGMGTMAVTIKPRMGTSIMFTKSARRTRLRLLRVCRTSRQVTFKPMPSIVMTRKIYTLSFARGAIGRVAIISFLSFYKSFFVVNLL